MAKQEFAKDELSLIYSSLGEELNYLTRNRIFTERRTRIVALREKAINLWLDVCEEKN